MGGIEGTARSADSAIVHTPPAGAGGFAGRAREGQFDWVEDVYKTGIRVIEIGDRVSGALFHSVASLLDARTYIHSFKTLGTAAGETAGSGWLVFVRGERTFAQEFPTTHRTVTDPAAQFEAMVKAPGGEWYDPQVWVDDPVEAATFTLETAASVAPQAALMAYGMAPATTNNMVVAGANNLGRTVGRGLDGAGETLFGSPAAVAVTPNGAMVVVPLAQESEALFSAGAVAAGAGGRVANIGVATGAAVHQMSAAGTSGGVSAAGSGGSPALLEEVVKRIESLRGGLKDIGDPRFEARALKALASAEQKLRDGKSIVGVRLGIEALRKAADKIDASIFASSLEGFSRWLGNQDPRTFAGMKVTLYRYPGASHGTVVGRKGFTR